MRELKAEEFDPPYLLLLGDTTDATHAKTALGILQWQPERVLGQWRFEGCDVDLGIPDLSPRAARQRGARSLIVGVAPAGGVIPEHWWQCIEEAATCGLDIVSGLHTRLMDRPSLARIAREEGVRLVDIRIPPKNIPVATGRKRSGKRLLTVGTDCAIGKKYTALALHAAMREAGIDATFRATGQTGIMLAGGGIPLDAVVADFVAGAAEMLSPANAPDHWDVIEGQGTLFHPAYSGVSLSLLHGSQPDAFVVAHDATRTRVSGWDDFELPGVAECIELHLLAGRRTNPDILCAGISVNTSGLDPEARKGWLCELSAETRLPCFDPLLDGCGEVVHFLQQHFSATQS